MPHTARVLLLLPAAAFIALTALTTAAQPADPATQNPLPPDTSDPPRHASFELFHENDGTAIKVNGRTDRHYTAGQGFTVGWSNNTAADTPDAARTGWGLTVVQQLFTPLDYFNASPNPDDRPHAGYLYAGGFWQHERRDALHHLEIDLGVVGPSARGEAAQEAIHDLRDLDDPNWSAQLRDELAANLTYRRKWRIDLAGGHTTAPPSNPGQATSAHWGTQLIPEIGVDAGTVYRRANAGLTLRLGLNLPDDFGPALLTQARSVTGSGSAGHRVSAYLYGKATGRYTEWNTFIEGSNQRNPSPAVSLEPWTGEFAVGLAADVRLCDNCRLAVTFSHTYLTPEFEEQTSYDSYASLSGRLAWTF